MLTIIVCGTNQVKSQQGIHLNNPDLWYLDNAIQDADRDGFSYIFVHAKSNGQNYMLSEDVLSKLFNLAGLDGVRVETMNPVSPDKFALEVSKHNRSKGI